MATIEAHRPSPHARTGAGRRRALPGWLAVCGTLFAVAWGGNEFTPLLVMYRLESGMSVQVVNVLLGAYVLGIVPALLVGGPLSDRHGRRPLLFPAPVLCVIGSGLLALGPDSVALLFAGRVFSGLALGLVMAVGTSWVKELSQPPHDTGATAGSGAVRASLALTLGFLLGAVVAAAIAQFAPMSAVLPYAVNIVITVLLAVALLRVPETHGRGTVPGGLLDDLRVPAALHRRFLLVVVPMAPWVFGTSATAYAILPNLLAHRVPGYEVGFSGLLCMVALASGVLSQQVAKRVDSPHSSRAVLVALGTAAVGMALAVWASAALTIPAALVAAAVLGAAYGLLLVSGLQEVQRIAGPDRLAGLTAVYYSLAYLGFFVPAALAALTGWFDYPAMFAVGTGLALLCALAFALSWRRHLPAAH
ncbi:MFS transporter [Nocardiopsis sp. L17-MgMaSL7]|uniref:MFS transporter n=1 Tax=Nocardiopsis sp. L17-MgMaSL7 TaxID=1938893 RepID=UPI000D719E76|nr:MFS transporter [Nocardiopsis sp. L17-MgMaSL7]PWV47253.1 putative MFS family arabinose efflux permease [Nocardiopsis sp. L17-MgMaSL7]